jgi:ABC-type sugar transport system, periplasmic component
MLSFGIPVLLILSILSSALVIGREKPAELVFWTAPNKFQNRYNKEIVDTWNRENPDIKIKWTPIPQGESSEEVIFAAIASETAPNLLTNVFSGFAETLAKNKVLIPLDTLPGFEELIKERDMVDIIEYYRSPDGHIYVIPIYTNAMLWRYNKELLDELGLDKPPRTYDELLSLADKVVVPHKNGWFSDHMRQDGGKDGLIS